MVEGSLKRSEITADVAIPTTATAAAEEERIDEVSDTVTYRGFADPGTLNNAATWRIRKVETVGAVTSYKWADGKSSYDKVWDNRGTYNY